MHDRFQSYQCSTMPKLSSAYLVGLKVFEGLAVGFAIGFLDGFDVGAADEIA